MSATQEGVEEVVDIQVGNKEREDRMAEIVQRSQQERDKELGITPEELVEEIEQNIEEPDDEEVVEEEAKKEVTPTADLVTIKVDGVEMLVPREKVEEAGRRALQKESTADKRLEEATRILREAEQAKAAKQNSQARINEAEIAQRIRMGTDEEAIEAIKAIRGAPTATPQQIAEYATRQALDGVDYQNASTWFVENYQDITNDPYLLRLASIEEDRLRAEGDNRPRKDLYKEIGDGIRKWRGGTSESATEKREKKATITNLPSASARKVAPVQPKPKDATQIIAEMRKARGQVA